MKTQPIAAKTGMGAVDLAVTDGETALRFYRDYVGLKPLPSEGNEIRMGAGNRELVVLHPGAESTHADLPSFGAAPRKARPREGLTLPHTVSQRERGSTTGRCSNCGAAGFRNHRAAV